MQHGDPNAALSGGQVRAADAGSKAMMPIAFGRPFLDWVLSALADAGVRDICLVIAPEHNEIRNYYSRLTLTRVRVSFVVQQEARGTADAVLAAEEFSDGDSTLVLNGDNYYPAEAYRALIALGAPALVAFDRDALLAYGNIDADRIARYALLDIDDRGVLRRIIEKPDASTMAAWSGQYVSMNLWSFPPRFAEACRAVKPSARGELELPAAVQYAIDELGFEFRTAPISGPGAGVLDLTSRGDVQSIVERLSPRRPIL
jgi:glucose-1-phosphate thymidylyltransferase